MSERQLSFFDAEAAYEYQRQQKQAELDALMLSIIGPEETKKWHAKNARMRAKLDEAYSKPISPHIQASIDEMRANIRAATKPLADDFAQLGITQGATKREIKNAYRRQARKLHPDAGGDEAAFKRLHEAYRRALASVKE